MDKKLLQDLIDSNQPFKVETASGKVFDIPHQDFVRFSSKKTTLYIFWEENDEERFAMVPLLTITAVYAKEPTDAAKR